MGDRVGAGSTAWATLEGALRTAAIFMTTEARLSVCTHLRELADELEQDAQADVKEGASVGGRHRH